MGWLLRRQRQRGRQPSPTFLLRTAGGCVCAQLSRDAPPLLPDGYKVGEKVLHIEGVGVLFVLRPEPSMIFRAFSRPVLPL